MLCEKTPLLILDAEKVNGDLNLHKLERNWRKSFVKPLPQRRKEEESVIFSL